ncbi:MAG: hypothetical protein MUE51_05020 [Thermoleophilia bacterium]|nr:hypothetical protein [Thermoleophilia bacterium]
MADAVRIEYEVLHVGDLAVTFHRTLRLPDDGREYPLPPGLGRFPLLRVDDFADRVPAGWRGRGGVFLPMWQREAMWMSFTPRHHWRPQAVKVAAGMVNAVSGGPWSDRLEADDDHLVCPPQPWLDGFKTADGQVRQFIAMPLGMGYTAEGQLTGEETFGGLQLMVVPPKAGRFAAPAPVLRRLEGAGAPDAIMAPMAAAPAAAPAGAAMGLGAGGRMRQKVYPDPHGLDAWDQDHPARVFVHIVNSAMFREITGRAAPESPVSAREYARAGLPWFDLYDEHMGDVPASDALAGLRSVKEMDAEHGFAAQQDDAPVDAPGVAAPGAGAVRDGEW